MSRSAEKLFARLQRTTADWAPEQLAQILEGYGFTRKKEARHGTFFEHPSYAEWATVTIPRHQTLRNWVARDVLQRVERVLEEERGKGT